VVPNPPDVPALPDLLVRWSERPATQLDRVVSSRFGEVARRGLGSGRSGNHTAEAWAVVADRAASRRDDGRAASVVDLAATVCAAFGAETDDLDGQPLVFR
jgi:hypothetical protein